MTVATLNLGWERIETTWWPCIAESICGVWPEAAACMDLRWFAAQVRLGRLKRRPGRGKLQKRWGWSDKKVRLLLKAVHKWVDPKFGDAKEGPAQGRERAEKGPGEGQNLNRKETLNGIRRAGQGPGWVQAGACNGPHARIYTPQPPTPSPPTIRVGSSNEISPDPVFPQPAQECLSAAPADPPPPPPPKPLPPQPASASVSTALVVLQGRQDGQNTEGRVQVIDVGPERRWGPDNPAPLSTPIDTWLPPSPGFPDGRLLISERIGRMLWEIGVFTLAAVVRRSRKALSEDLTRVTEGRLDDLEADLEAVGHALRPSGRQDRAPRSAARRERAYADPADIHQIPCLGLDEKVDHLWFAHGRHKRGQHGI